MLSSWFIDTYNRVGLNLDFSLPFLCFLLLTRLVLVIGLSCLFICCSYYCLAWLMGVITYNAYLYWVLRFS